jgi:CubicO group peptidase (beta-lactamase class C family)
MAHYLIAHLNGGCYRRSGSGADSGSGSGADSGVQILSEMGIDELQRGAAEWKEMGRSFGSYGMGWVSQGAGKSRIVSHSGNVPDFSAFMALVPEQKKGIVLLFNADPYGLPPITEEIGMGATALLAGQQPAPIRLDFVKWIMRLLPLIPLLQVVGVFASLKTLRRWEREPARRPSSGGAWGQQIVLPLIPNLSLAAALVYLRSSGLIHFLHMFMPDIAWIARISGVLAGVWALVRTGLVLRAMRKNA